MNLYDINYIKPLLSRYGFHFSKSLGQNFLTAKWVPEKIVENAGLSSTSGILEIGPGIGVLTRELSKEASKVVAVELDKKLIPLLEETLFDCENVTVINENILKTDLKALCDNYFAGLSPSVCANLPYNITTPVLTALIEAGCFKNITVMVQREVAKRICSEPGSADYGAFTVYVQYHAQTRILFDVPPDCFIPRPAVTSSVITLTPKAKPDYVINEALFFKTVRAAFAQRRKTLVNSLNSVFGDNPGKETLAEIITKCGFDERIRGESLGISEFAAISNELSHSLKKN